MANYLKNQEKLLSVKQPNALTEARYEMSALQKDIFYFLLMEFDLKDLSKTQYSISIKKINTKRNVKVKRTELLEAANGLIGAGIFIFSNKIKDFEALAIFHSVEEGEGEEKDNLIVKFDLGLIPYLIDVKERFTLLNLQNALNLKSKYSKRVYEMLSQFKGKYKIQKAKNEECIINISVQELKYRLAIVDPKTGADKYPDFGIFSQNVLTPAIREINGNTEISFKCEKIQPKTGKKITNLQFKITDIEGIEKLSELPESSLEASKELSETTQPDTKSITGLTPESPKMLTTPTQEGSELTSLEKELYESCEIDPALAKKVVEKGPEKEVRKLMNGLLKKHKAGKIESLGGYSTTIFRVWLNGAEPKFEKTDLQAKHIPLKSAGQTNQIGALQTEVQKKLSDLGLGRNTVYGFMVKYGGEIESLKKLSIAISKVEAGIEKGEVERNPEDMFEAINKILNGKEKNFNQSLASESSERSNSLNSLGSLLASSITKPIISTLTTEQEKISREKTAIWKELQDLFPINDQQASDFVEEYSVEASKYAIRIVVEALKNQTISQDPAIIAEELRKYSSSWKP